MQHIRLFFCVLPSLLSIELFAFEDKPHVFFCYGRLNPTEIAGFDYVILESKNYNASDIKKVKKLNGKVLAYISLGEINSQAKSYEQLKGFTLGKNENWDSYYLDLKAEQTSVILFSIIDKILADGYDGLFLDNIDNYTIHGFQKEQRGEIVSFIKKLKETHPEHFLLQNAGLELVPETAKFINGVVVESVASNYTFNDNTYKLRDEKEYSEYIKKLNVLRRKYNLPIILVEYADTQELYNEIKKRISRTNFLYFIGTIDLQGFPNFPK